jgi:3-hydroxyisobutyrate dehydrogenase-like beta-hydroxyacid dehydrogenase
VLTTLGRRVLHTGPVGSASVLEVVTSYLASANLVALTEALATATAAGMDLSQLLRTLVGDAIDRYGPDEHSPDVIRRLEDAARLDVRADGFPARLVDSEPPSVGVEVAPPPVS